MNIPNWIKKKRIAVLYGGRSVENEISRRTGKAVVNAFRELKLDAVGIDVDRFLARDLIRKKINYCFIALHGSFGEDGTVQGMCEMMDIPYSGSGVLASALCMNKAASKYICLSNGIITAPFEILDSGEITVGKGKVKIPMPLVVKPVDGGSAIGVSIVREKREMQRALRTAAKHSRKVLVEKFIKGKEVTVPILGQRALAVIEIVPKSSFYDFRAKYVKGMSDHILPARISGKVERQVKDMALAAHAVLGCRAYSRVDFIIDKECRPWLLEVNTIPGMTETSLFPEASKASGLSFPETILEIMKNSRDE